MVSLKQKQSGFTIVELLIVIVIIGILATLVIVTFSGVQQKARDSERKTDINAVANVLEAFYANAGYYPPRVDVNSETWRSSNDMKLDAKSLGDPTGVKAATPVLDLQAATSATTQGTDKVYYYWAADESGTACTTTGAKCASYVLTANLENVTGGATFKRNSN